MGTSVPDIMIDGLAVKSSPKTLYGCDGYWLFTFGITGSGGSGTPRTGGALFICVGAKTGGSGTVDISFGGGGSGTAHGFVTGSGGSGTFHIFSTTAWQLDFSVTFGTETDIAWCSGFAFSLTTPELVEVIS